MMDANSFTPITSSRRTGSMRYVCMDGWVDGGREGSSRSWIIMDYHKLPGASNLGEINTCFCAATFSDQYLSMAL